MQSPIEKIKEKIRCMEKAQALAKDPQLKKIFTKALANARQVLANRIVVERIINGNDSTSA